MNDWLEIINLIYNYNDCIDRGDLKAAATLFKNAMVRIPGNDNPVNWETFLSLLERVVIIYADGTPKTRHLVTNPIIQIDEKAGLAQGKSTFTVLQYTDTLPLQVIATGYYNDRFEKHNNQWRFAFRESTLPHLYGKIHEHINFKAL